MPASKTGPCRPRLPATSGPRDWSLHPLVDWLGDVGALARLLGVDKRTIYRYLAHGITEEQADYLATACGTHPCLIWPEWFGRPTIAAGPAFQRDRPPAIRPAGEAPAVAPSASAGAGDPGVKS